MLLQEEGIAVSETESVYCLCVGDACCEVSKLIGAHALSFKIRETEVLFLSERAILTGASPVRGGVPLCFPQFSKYGPFPTSHGFARNSRRWQFERVFTEVHPEPTVALTLSLTGPLPAPDLSSTFPSPFQYLVTFRLTGRSLHIRSEVKNTGDDTLRFGLAYHPYFRVPDIRHTGVRGLADTLYKDQLGADPAQEFVQRDEVVSFTGEVDRIYKNAGDRVVIEDTRTHIPLVVVEKERMPDVVVWNPWIAKSAKMSDLHPGDYLRFVCVEPAQISLVDLPPQGTWSCGVKFTPVL